MYGFLVSGYDKRGLVVKHSLRWSKAAWHSLFHSNLANFLVSLIKGFAFAEKFGINLLIITAHTKEASYLSDTAWWIHILYHLNLVRICHDALSVDYEAQILSLLLHKFTLTFYFN